MFKYGGTVGGKTAFIIIFNLILLEISVLYYVSRKIYKSICLSKIIENACQNTLKYTKQQQKNPTTTNKQKTSNKSISIYTSYHDHDTSGGII
jgi:hypothetical protein